LSDEDYPVMPRKELTIKNRLGLHARAAAQFVQTANQFQSEITVAKDGDTVNGKSIMGILMLAAPKGSLVVVNAEGQDAAEALQALEKLIDGRFGED